VQKVWPKACAAELSKKCVFDYKSGSYERN